VVAGSVREAVELSPLAPGLAYGVARGLAYLPVVVAPLALHFLKSEARLDCDLALGAAL
jgi:hypothetical protein